MRDGNGCEFVNGSVLNEHYMLVYEPEIVDLEIRFSAGRAVKHGYCSNQIARAVSIRASAGTPMAVVFASIG